MNKAALKILLHGFLFLFLLFGGHILSFLLCAPKSGIAES